MWCYEKDLDDNVISLQPGLYTFRETRLSPEVCWANRTASWTERKRLLWGIFPLSKAPPASSSSYTWAAGGKTTNIKQGLARTVKLILPDIIWYLKRKTDTDNSVYQEKNTDLSHIRLTLLWIIRFIWIYSGRNKCVNSLDLPHQIVMNCDVDLQVTSIDNNKCA